MHAQRNQSPRPRATTPYTQVMPCTGTSSSEQAIIAIVYAIISRATLVSLATTGSIGTPAAA